MSNPKEAFPIPGEFSVVYESGSLSYVTIRTIGEQAKGLPVNIGLSTTTPLDGSFLTDQTTTLRINKVSTTIKSALSKAGIPPYEYVTIKHALKLQESLRDRNADSAQLETQQGKTILYLPRKSETSAYAEINLGYPSREECMRNAVYAGDLGNGEISMQLTVANEIFLIMHAGPAIFDFYFSRYEKFLKSLYGVMGLPLPSEPIVIHPLDLKGNAKG